VGPFRPEPARRRISTGSRAGDAGIRRIEVPRTLLSRRVHDRNLTGEVPSPQQAWLNTLRASVARKQGRA
jgi:hypothetical protein